jgi:hypothetical protein
MYICIYIYVHRVEPQCRVIQQMWMDAKDVNYTANNGQGLVLKYVYLKPH